MVVGAASWIHDYYCVDKYSARVKPSMTNYETNSSPLHRCRIDVETLKFNVCVRVDERTFDSTGLQNEQPIDSWNDSLTLIDGQSPIKIEYSKRQHDANADAAAPFTSDDASCSYENE